MVLKEIPHFSNYVVMPHFECIIVKTEGQTRIFLQWTKRKK